jgi:uncharacterized protein YeaO (DUF488 family)
VTMLKTKSVSSPISRKDDGIRILVTRFRGRGLPSSNYDVWVASLGPSEELLRRFQQGVLTWSAFSREYRGEMFMNGPIDARSKTIKNHGQKFSLRMIKFLASASHVTLLCHCAEDQKHCHRHVLQKLILSARV